MVYEGSIRFDFNKKLRHCIGSHVYVGHQGLRIEKAP